MVSAPEVTILGMSATTVGVEFPEICTLLAFEIICRLSFILNLKVMAGVNPRLTCCSPWQSLTAVALTE